MNIYKKKTFLFKFAQNLKIMKKTGIFVTLLICFLSCQTEKTGFVDTETLLTEYEELKVTKERYTKESNKTITEVEARIKEYKTKENSFRENAPSMSRKRREEKAEELTIERQKLQRFQESKIGQLQLDSQTAIDSLITKVKDRVITYGKENGYSYIYGSNDAGSVLYGKENLDLTQTILSALNNEYESSKK